MVDKKTGRRSKRPPPFVKRGQVVIARMEIAGPICLETYANHQQLGRFTLRDEGTAPMLHVRSFMPQAKQSPWEK